MADVEMTDPPAASSKIKKSNADGDAGGEGKKRFEVKKWNAVALWAWDITVDNCAICRNHIMDLCTYTVRSKDKQRHGPYADYDYRHRVSSQPPVIHK